ncbi:MAG: hypothetical protein ACOY0S_00825 [Patescibacteria group bacterium]
MITGLEIAKNLRYGDQKEIDHCIIEVQEISAMIVGLVQSLKKH